MEDFKKSELVGVFIKKNNAKKPGQIPKNFESDQNNRCIEMKG